MKKRVLLQSAVLLAATVNLSQVAASCFPPTSGQYRLRCLSAFIVNLTVSKSELLSLKKRIGNFKPITGELKDGHQVRL
jgi:hypothetical protein